MADKDLFSEINRYAKEYTKEEDITKSFPYLCLKIYFPKLSDEEIDDAIQGLGSNDEGIDAFWIDHDDQIINIAQFKSVTSYKRAKEDKAEKGWFALLADVERKLKDDLYVQNCSNKRILDDIIPKYREAKHSEYTVKLHLYHLGNCSDQILKSYSNIEYYCLDDICEQFNEFKSMTSYDNPKDCTLELSFPNTDTKFLKYQAKYKGSRDTYIVILTGMDLIELREEHRYQLFNRNVRYFLGENNIVNKEIIKTAKETPEIFYCYNNGITITCSECRDNKKNYLKLIHPQIINGAQTVNSLYVAYEQMVREKQRTTTPDKEQAKWQVRAHFNNIKVLCRIVTSTIGDQTNFAENLTKYTNSQNDVKVFDFCANRPEQREIQKKMAKYGYFYERKRGERKYFEKSKEEHDDLKIKFSSLPEETRNIKINTQTLAGIYQAYLGKPSYAETDYKKILSNPTENEDYKNIFGVTTTDVTDSKIKSMLLAVYIYNFIDSQVKDFDKADKAWKILVQNKGNPDENVKSFRTALSNIKFIEQSTKNDLLNIENYIVNSEEINRRLITKFELLHRCKYMFTGLTKYIMERNNYLDNIFDNNLYNNKNIIEKYLISWIIPINIILNSVYNEIKATESISTENFYKRVNIFDKLKSRLIDKVDDDGWDLKEKFKFSI